MEELITTFHIDWKLMVAQIVNFAIVVAVVWYFAVKPLMKTMRDRSIAIDKSLRQAAEIEQKFKQAQSDVAEKIREARHQATAVLEQAKRQAEAKKDEMITRTKQDVAGIIAQAREQIKQEKEAMMVEARGELADLIVVGVDRVLGSTMDESVQKKINKDRLRKLA